MAEISNLAPGEEHRIAITRDPDYRFFVADNVTVSQSMNGLVDLSGMALRTRPTEQLFTVLETEVGSATLSGGKTTVEPAIVEAGTMRLTPETALGLSLLLLSHLAAHGSMTPEEIRARLATLDLG